MRRTIHVIIVLVASIVLMAGGALAIGVQPGQPPATQDPQQSPPPKAKPRERAPEKGQPQKKEPEKTQPRAPEKAQPRAPEKAEPRAPEKAEPRKPQPRAPESTPPRTVQPRPPQEARPRPPRSLPPRPPRHTAVVFIGGYFYDPYFGPYPWWARAAYPYGYYPIYESRAMLRIDARPEDAAVYVDGFYAGIVEDFNGFFEGLPLPPGGHEVVLYRDGYGTIERRLYLAPGSSFELHEQLILLAPGETGVLPTLAPALPPPPAGTALPPPTPEPDMAGEPPQAMPASGFGTLSLRVQPADATLLIDGEPWASSEAGHLVVQLAPGVHRLEISRSGYRSYSGEVKVHEGRRVPLNVSLTVEPQ